MLKEKFIKYLRYEKNYSSHTEISYYKDITQFQAFVENEVGEFDPLAIDSDIIRMWMVLLMEQGMKPSTVNRKLSAVKSFFRYLQRKEYLEVNPALYLEGPKMNQKLPDFVKHQDMLKVLSPESFTDDFEGHRNRFIIQLLYLTGIRTEELLNIKDTDVDLSSNTLQIHGKGNKDRLMPISDKTAQLFQEYISIRNEEVENITPYLFVRKNGKQLYQRLLYSIVNTHLSEVKTLSKKSPHVLRHSFATAMLNNGAEINSVKSLLGHESLASTQVYTHVTFKELKKVYNNAHPRA